MTGDSEQDSVMCVCVFSNRYVSFTVPKMHT